MSIRQKLFEAGPQPEDGTDPRTIEARKLVERRKAEVEEQEAEIAAQEESKQRKENLKKAGIKGSSFITGDGVGHMGGDQPQETWLDRGKRWVTKNPWHVGGGALAATAAGLGGLALSRHLRKKKRDSEKKDK